MATRSAIGYALPSGKVCAVYCHWDGSPSHQLPILKEHYNSLPKVRALVKPGSMSQLCTTDTWGSDYPRDANGKADFDAPRTEQRPAQPLYHHERGHGGYPPFSVPDADAPSHWAEYGCEHLYVFRPGYGWFHYEL
ncbi:MAG: hypothetical protein ACO3JL_14490 [Myxococcota bacterium]